MNLYHVIDSVSMYVPAMMRIFAPERPARYLIAASAYMRPSDRRIHDRIAEIRAGATSLLFDSGGLGFIKSGRLEMLRQPHDVATMALETGADRIAHLDIPCEPEILNMAGLTVQEAVDLTIENAELCMADRRLDGRRIISVQGWTLEERQACLERLIPILDQDPGAWIGCGTTCMLTPKTGLFTIYEWLCDQEAVQGRHIHAWGIAQATWLAHLARLGVAGGDSATAGVRACHGKALSSVTGQNGGRIPPGPRDKRMAALDAARNMCAMELALQGQLTGQEVRRRVRGHEQRQARLFSLYAGLSISSQE